MSNKKQQIPAIRFNGFTDTWEQRKLKEVSERVRGNDERMNLPTLTISAGSGWLDQRERFSGNIAGNEQKNYTLLSKGELSYNHGNSKLAKYGVVFALRTFEEALVPRVYHSFKTTDEASADFVEYMFATKRPDRELAKLVSSGARMDGLLNINYDEFMGINIMVPEIDEQKRISNFLRQLDDTIALHQRQLRKFEKMRKTMLQNMFPRNEEKYPKIRFDGFNKDWEEKRLIDVADSYDNLRVPVTASDRVKGNTPYYGANGIQDYVEGFTHDGEFILIAEDGANDLVNYPVNYVNGKVWVNNHAHVVSGKKEYLDNLFLASRIRSMNISTLLVGGGRAKLNGDVLKKMPLMLPSLAEQLKIGNFFKHLDDTIVIHQQKISNYQEIKKVMLQQMFV